MGIKPISNGNMFAIVARTNLAARLGFPARGTGRRRQGRQSEPGPSAVPRRQRARAGDRQDHRYPGLKASPFGVLAAPPGGKPL